MDGVDAVIESEELGGSVRKAHTHVVRGNDPKTCLAQLENQVSPQKRPGGVTM
jgi:hypothetical protein